MMREAKANLARIVLYMLLRRRMAGETPTLVLDCLEAGSFTVHCMKWKQRAREGKERRGKRVIQNNSGYADGRD